MVQPPLDPSAGAHQAAIRVTSGTFAWESEGEPALRSVNLEVLSGQLLMVVGEVGSGKSSLLSALLGEMKVWSGNVHVAGARAAMTRIPSRRPAKSHPEKCFPDMNTGGVNQSESDLSTQLELRFKFCLDPRLATQALLCRMLQGQS